ncbi:hypothetical protein DS745_03395 [Anaerobacillus alkaliphilus]|uniref:Uncharacterized protein n=1 Tax=Anaerobacillus alkaliphilus TaxID=1548597 RepID=A0A4Q0VXN1_9BACI|nr:hypothetical protein [Anaerobacillus alkaliphilus]RXJ04444.1 hypothetical protein DS745_03395 [Anaerobacillus alkaliphilus]
MKKAKNYCGAIFAVGVILFIIGIFNIIYSNVNVYFVGLGDVSLYFLLSTGSVLLFISYIISKILDNIEVEINEVKDRTLNLDIKINNQRRL